MEAAQHNLKLAVPNLAISVSQRSGATFNSYHTALSHLSPCGTVSSYNTADSVQPWCGTPSTINSSDGASTFEVSEDDIVIAIMGPTGAGKSTFVKLATGSDDIQIGHSLRSCTQHIRVVRCQSPLRERSVVFVDTPGFDDDSRSDTQILTEIAEWLEKTYKAGVKLTGVLYLHRITDNRMTNTILRNLEMFQNLCGNKALTNVRLVTTQWDSLKDEKQGIKNEGELRKNYWNMFLGGGSKMLRFEYTCASAWNIIGSLPMEPKVMKIQEEMVDQHKHLHETSAARSLLSWVHYAVEALKNFIRQLEELIQKVTSADSSETKKRRDSENKKREEQLRTARKMLKRFQNDESQIYNRSATTNPHQSPRSPTPDSASTTSTWRYIARKISEKRMKRRARHSPQLSPCSESDTAVYDPLEDGSYVLCESPSSSSTLVSLSLIIQRLHAVRVTAAPGVVPGFDDVVGICLKIAETLNEAPSTHCLSSLMDSTSRLLCTLSDQYSPTKVYPNTVSETFDDIRRQLVLVQGVVMRLPGRKTEPQTSSILSADDHRVVSDCQKAVTSATHQLKAN